jgi:hypothetical protein
MLTNATSTMHFASDADDRSSRMRKRWPTIAQTAEQHTPTIVLAGPPLGKHRGRSRIHMEEMEES